MAFLGIGPLGRVTFVSQLFWWSSEILLYLYMHVIQDSVFHGHFLKGQNGHAVSV